VTSHWQWWLDQCFAWRRPHHSLFLESGISVSEGTRREKHNLHIECFKIQNFHFSWLQFNYCYTFTQNTLCFVLADRGHDTQHLVIFLMFTNDLHRRGNPEILISKARFIPSHFCRVDWIQWNEFNSMELRRLNRLPHFCRAFYWNATPIQTSNFWPVESHQLHIRRCLVTLLLGVTKQEAYPHTLSFKRGWEIHLILLPLLRFLLYVRHFVNPLHGLTNVVFLAEWVG